MLHVQIVKKKDKPLQRCQIWIFRLV